MLSPGIKYKEWGELYAELEAFTNRADTDSTFFREAWVFVKPYPEIFVKFGLDDRFISPEFFSSLKAQGENKRLTEQYPINGIALWKDEDLGITGGGDHPIGGGTSLLWRASLTNGLILDHDEITRSRIYPILHADREAQNINVDSTDAKEVGVGGGFKHEFDGQSSLAVMGFRYISKLSTGDMNFLRDVIPGYTSQKNTYDFFGFNLDLNISQFNLFAQGVHARAGLVVWDGFYLQPSLSLNQWQIGYRYNLYTIQKTGGETSKNPVSPFTWDRTTHTVAVNLELYKSVLWQNEYHLNNEVTGGNRNSVKNNEFISQLEFRF